MILFNIQCPFWLLVTCFDPNANNLNSVPNNPFAAFIPPSKTIMKHTFSISGCLASSLDI